MRLYRQAQADTDTNMGQRTADTDRRLADTDTGTGTDSWLTQILHTHFFAETEGDTDTAHKRHRHTFG